MQVELLIIDPQVDFCDPMGALSVPGAATNRTRLAPKLDAIHVTLDSHHFGDIAHPIFWKDSAGNHPAPFTHVSPHDSPALGPWFACFGMDYADFREWFLGASNSVWGRDLVAAP